MSSNVSYRIKGLSDLPARVETTSPKTPIFYPKSKVGESHPGEVPWKNAVQAIGIPHIRHHIYGFRLPELSRLWPTFSFLQEPTSRTVKTVPVALSAYLDKDKDRPELADLVFEWENQNAESENLKKIVTWASSNEEPDEDIFTPIASAIAATLFRGSRWTHKHKGRLLQVITELPIASYIALKGGACVGETTRLIQAVSGDGRLLIDLWRSHLWSPYIASSLIQEATESAPHLVSLTSFPHLKITHDNAWNDLSSAANQNPMAVAFCLGLDLDHPLAEQWITTVKSSPQAMYWSLRIGGWGLDRTRLPYWDDFRKVLWNDPQWGFHMIRDFESGSAREWIDFHWPNPWAIELLSDLALPKDWCLRRYREMNIDPQSKDRLLLGLTLWAADYVTEDEDES